MGARGGRWWDSGAAAPYPILNGLRQLLYSTSALTTYSQQGKSVAGSI